MFTNKKETKTWAKKADPQYSAIFIVKNKSGEPQYLNRLDAGHKVSISTLGTIMAYFTNQKEKYLENQAFLCL
jgi:hypothetical protein